MSLPSQHSSKLEQPGAELMVPLTRFWERSGRIVTYALAAIVVLGVLGFFYMRSRRAAEEAAAGKLAEAALYYWQGDYQRSLALAREVGQQYASTPSGVDSHRQAGDAAYWGGDFKTAVAEYQAYLAKNPRGLLGDAARRSLAYSLESNGQPIEAAKEYEALVGRFDRSSSAEFLLAAARCYRTAGQNQEAMTRLRRLVDEFGETDYATQGRIDLAEVEAAGPAAARP